MTVNFNGKDLNAPYGAMNRIGTTADNRIVYQVTDYAGKDVGKMSVALQDCDAFEKSYESLMEAVPKYQNYAQTHSSPGALSKRRNILLGTMATTGVLGGAGPLFIKSLSGWKKAALSALGGVVGLVAGAVAGAQLLVPPGFRQIRKAQMTLAKLDIQPVLEQKK